MFLFICCYFFSFSLDQFLRVRVYHNVFILSLSLRTPCIHICPVSVSFAYYNINISTRLIYVYSVPLVVDFMLNTAHNLFSFILFQKNENFNAGYTQLEK